MLSSVVRITPRFCQPTRVPMLRLRAASCPSFCNGNRESTAPTFAPAHRTSNGLGYPDAGQSGSAVEERFAARDATYDQGLLWTSRTTIISTTCFLQHHPRQSICCTPFVAVCPEKAPVAYSELKAMWLQHLAEAPADVQLVRGAAAFIAAESADEGKMLIRSTLAHHPNAAVLWFDVGRISQDPGERIAAFEKACDTGEQNSNLLVWIASTAFEAGEFAKAQRASHELMALVDEVRSRFGDNLDWPERGGQLWRRARECSESNADANTITNAIGQHAYRKHWAHTVLGLLACRADDIGRAVSHLRESADVRSDSRLSSYGPSSDLLPGMCSRSLAGRVGLPECLARCMG